MAEVAEIYEHINEMWFFPFDSKAFAVLGIAALLPFAALPPLKEMILRIREMLVLWLRERLPAKRGFVPIFP